MSDKEEGYEGIRFESVSIGREAPTDPRIEELMYWCKLFDDYHLAPPYPGGSFGNLSFRVTEGQNDCIITTARTGLGALTNKCFAKVSGVDWEQRHVYSSCIIGKDPSSESMVHFVIYRERPEINAIFHGHSAEILNYAESLKIPETEREVPYGTIELVEEVLKVLDNESFFVMKNHGFVALGRTMGETGELTLRMYRQCVRIPTLV